MSFNNKENTSMERYDSRKIEVFERPPIDVKKGKKVQQGEYASMKVRKDKSPIKK
jgi:hypothetical protein